MFKRTAGVAVTLTCVSLAAAPALARERFTDYVKPFRSVGGIPIKATPSQIKAKFGKPASVFHESGKISGFQYQFGTIEVQIDFDTQNKTDGAIEIDAGGVVPGDGKRLHTIDGIHIGTSAAVARKRLSGYKGFQVSKGLGFTIDKGPPAGEPGSYQTTFGTSGGKIDDISLDYVFNDG